MSRQPIKVLHITAHLGGGVGKALSGLVRFTAPASRIQHTIACLEYPEKRQFIDQITAAGVQVRIGPDRDELVQMVAVADIVQLEWWNHPVTIQMLCSDGLPPMRLLLWCHISGLYNPIIPRRLIESAQRCLFTSPCSYQADEAASLLPELRDRMAVVHSTGGFAGLAPAVRPPAEPIGAGYVGSLNFAKLHPRYVDFLAAVPGGEHSVTMVGDSTHRDILQRQCKAAGREGMIRFRGYTTDIAAELSSFNVFSYLLNPRHYGTTENALLEAMAMGVVPIVLDNPAESSIVEHLVTGMIVHTPEEYAGAITRLAKDPESRRRMGLAASGSVRNKFSIDKLEEGFNRHYSELMEIEKKDIEFSDIFGKFPSEWFISCQKNKNIFSETNHRSNTVETYSLYELFEETKGTVFHFLKYFPK